MADSSQTPECPKCGDDRVQEIYYSDGCGVEIIRDTMDPELWESYDKQAPNSPKWHCTNCGKEWPTSAWLHFFTPDFGRKLKTFFAANWFKVVISAFLLAVVLFLFLTLPNLLYSGY